MRNTLLYIVFLLSIPLQGQISFQNDTIKIKEVVINSKKASSNLTGLKMSSIDSSTLNNYTHSTLADLISDNSQIFIKSYGMGGTATPSFRGTGAGHTQIAWNNININNPMLGQSDLSLIPSGIVDDIKIYFGSASMTMSSGGIGGTINLETRPDWKRETLISINPGVGSFGRYTGFAKVKAGNNHFQTVTKYFLQSSENDFRYLNSEIRSEPVWQTRENNQVSQQGFLQELYYRRRNNVTSASIWYQSAKRNLPSSMLTRQVNSGERQFDESLRTMLKYEISRGSYDYFFTGAFMLSRLNYHNQLASIDSRNLAETLVLKAGMESMIGENTKLKVVIDEELDVVKSNNYDQNKKRNTASITATAEINSSNRFGVMLLLREIFDNHNFLIPDFTVGLQFRIADVRDYFLKANFSRNSKIPTMNDMFWVPGGNPGIRNEYAFIYEITYEMNQKISAPVTTSYDISIFRNTINDMIQWHPGEYSYWTADNIQNVNSMGLESTLSLYYTSKNLTTGFKAGYSFTKATTGDSNDNNSTLAGKQLMYIPINQANASFRLSYKFFYSSWVTNLTGRRYITVDNSGYLPGCLLNNLMTGIKLNLKSTTLDMNFNIDNLFNVNYQSIAYYPLPGRSYAVKILVQIIK